MLNLLPGCSALLGEFRALLLENRALFTGWKLFYRIRTGTDALILKYMNVYVYICIHVYTYIFIYIYIYTYIYIYVHIYIYIYVYTHIYTYMYLYMHTYCFVYIYVGICIYLYIYVYMYLCLCICLYIYIYEHIYAYLNVYTQIQVYTQMSTVSWQRIYTNPNTSARDCRHTYRCTNIYTHEHAHAHIHAFRLKGFPIEITWMGGYLRCVYSFDLICTRAFDCFWIQACVDLVVSVSVSTSVTESMAIFFVSARVSGKKIVNLYEFVNVSNWTNEWSSRRSISP